MIKILKEAKFPENVAYNYKGFLIDFNSAPYGHGYRAIKDNFEIHSNNHLEPVDNYNALIKYIDEYVSTSSVSGRTKIDIQS